ncbi:MAG TPA: hypothetical protein VFV12_11405 [Xanthobacteraceae bacterium]|nr:hypothetical protein [Xanthobacteraceae bacterium]
MGSKLAIELGEKRDAGGEAKLGAGGDDPESSHHALRSFQQFPPRQKRGTFSVERVLEKLRNPPSSN